MYSSSLQRSIVLVSLILCLWWARTSWWWKHVTAATHHTSQNALRKEQETIFVKGMFPITYCLRQIPLLKFPQSSPRRVPLSGNSESNTWKWIAHSISAPRLFPTWKLPQCFWLALSFAHSSSDSHNSCFCVESPFSKWPLRNKC